jgi:hypothetical protein
MRSVAPGPQGHHRQAQHAAVQMQEGRHVKQECLAFALLTQLPTLLQGGR